MPDYSDPYELANEDNPYADGNSTDTADQNDSSALTEFDPENYSHEGNNPLTSFIANSNPTRDSSLLQTVGNFFGHNKELTSMLLSGFGGAMKGEQALQLYNRVRDDKLADQKRYSDSVAGMAPLNTGLIGSSMIQNLRGVK